MLPSIHSTITVTFNYAVEFTDGLFDSRNPLLARTIDTRQEQPKKVLAIVDAGLLARHPDLLHWLAVYADIHGSAFKLAAEPIIVPGGEAAKNDPSLPKAIHRAIDSAGLCRHSYLLAVGGGAVLDMVGYAAATAHRGVRLIRVPTTVLAQNDSGIGVKNGINAFNKKNFIGAFAPPYAVLNDSSFLTTLADRDWLAGTAEAIKVALIKDARFFASIAADASKLRERDIAVMQALIYRCAQLHLEHIATCGDPFETGSSRPLDFGHWAAHKLEQLTDYRLRHGEAVAIGIALDSAYSHLVGLLPHAELEQILSALEALDFELYVPELSMHHGSRHDVASLFHGIEEFREHLGGELTLMLLQEIGRGVEVHEVDEALYSRAIEWLQHRHVRRKTFLFAPDGEPIISNPRERARAAR